ncbi:hypothetical protein [Fibrella forsythiae]|uniref:NADH dehydrogenase subunit E n=1 Tax=Fibrella forsythiae TaxID=2817061 RepID=A0ABS3JI23_9BACT|nr:hypothetical protein [Fibrella forsythiae]MBO0949066.1 hypothetical protein [Fibrella forsythiae]
MFGLDPFSRPVAIIEMLLLLSLAAFVGWLIARLILNGRVSALQAEIAEKEAELDNCRRSKATASKPPVNTIRTDVASPSVVTEPLIVPAMAAPVLEVPVELPPVVETTVIQPVVGVVAPPLAEPVVLPTISSAPPVASSEDAVLNRIASRANEINFDRIGRATAAEADDLKDIVGVGPFLERKLHSLGIYTFRQVGNFTKEDIDKVNEIIEFFPGRIERDNWVSQSKAFYEQKYGGRVTE